MIRSPRRGRLRRPAAPRGSPLILRTSCRIPPEEPFPQLLPGASEPRADRAHGDPLDPGYLLVPEAVVLPQHERLPQVDVKRRERLPYLQGPLARMAARLRVRASIRRAPGVAYRRAAPRESQGPRDPEEERLDRPAARVIATRILEEHSEHGVKEVLGGFP